MRSPHDRDSPYFSLIGTQQLDCLVEIAVVGPSRFWFETDAPSVDEMIRMSHESIGFNHAAVVERTSTVYVPIATTASVRLTVRSAAVPGKSDEETSVVAEIRRPKVHRVGHERCQVGLDRGVSTFRDAAIAHEVFQPTTGMLP